MKSSSARKLEPVASVVNPLLLEPGHKLSEKIKAGTLTATKLCQVFIKRITCVQPKIKCMAEDRFELALQEAGKIDELVAKYRQAGAGTDERSDYKFTCEQMRMLKSPLLGVPVSIKESLEVKGMTNSIGSLKRRNVRAEQDTVAIINLKANGLIPICTTNIPEMTLYWADCVNPVYGKARNPYDLNRITCGSSGGEAGLFALGGSVIGVGSDIAGSIRTPSHCCGIFGHKTSPFLASPEGNIPAVKRPRIRMFALGPMCRYASDLRYVLKLLLSDVNNAKQDTYTRHQPEKIGKMRENVIAQLDGPALDLSQVKLFYCNFKRVNRVRALMGLRERKVQRELMEAQQEVLNHFVTKYNCQTELIDLDKYLDNAIAIWLAMLTCGASKEHETFFEDEELREVFLVSSVGWEAFKWLIGTSEHTKETLLSILATPWPRKKVYEMCEKFEKMGQIMRDEVEAKLGPNGVILMPTLPTVAHKFNRCLLKSNEARFPTLFNVLQFPATHAPIRLHKKYKLPYGVTFASRPFYDNITISLAEEVERAFGGWTLPENLVP